MIETANAYIVYDFDVWPGNPLNNLKLKNWLFGTTNIVKNSDKEKLVYSGYGIESDGTGNGSSSHTDNHKNNFLVLGEGPTFISNGSFDSLDKNFSIILVKQTQNFASIRIIMVVIVFVF